MSTTAIDFEIWKKKLHNFIGTYIKEKTERDDLTQEIFIKIIEKKNTLKNEESLDSWIYTVGRNILFNHFRKQARVNTCDCSTIQVIAEDNKAVNYNAELLECLPRYINKIPEEYRLALTLSDLELLPHKEVAKHLNISLTAAKSRIQRGRKKLQEVLEAGCYMEFDTYGNLITCIPKKKNLKKAASF